MVSGTPQGVGIERLDPIGVELRGFDVCGALRDSDFAWLRHTVVNEGFVLIRDQDIPTEQHIALGRRFGKLERLVVGDSDEEGSMIVLSNVDETGRTYADDDPRMKLMKINEGWHTDSSFREIPASVSLFAAVTVPEEGGDTLFASLQTAWDALDPDLRSRLVGMVGLHDYHDAYRKRGNESGDVVGFNMPCVRHPLVRIHPESGRVGLYVSEHVAGIEGMPEAEARLLLEQLLEVTTAPERVYRHAWRAGDLAIWDNRSMLHRAQGFDHRHPRVMHHVRVGGDEAPIGASSRG